MEKTLECPLDSTEIKSVNLKGNQPWIFIGKTDAEAEAPILWPPYVRCPFIGKDPDAGKDWGQEKGTTEDEMVGWQHWLNGHEFEWTLGDSKGQGSLVSYCPWGNKESDMTEQLNNDKLFKLENWIYLEIILTSKLSNTFPSWVFLPSGPSSLLWVEFFLNLSADLIARLLEPFRGSLWSLSNLDLMTFSLSPGPADSPTLLWSGQ